VAFLALIIDRYFSVSQVFTRYFSHPVVWQGWIIDVLETRLNSKNKSAVQRRLAGIKMLVILIFATLFVSLLLLWLFSFLPFSWVFEALFASILLAGTSLKKAVKSVAQALKISLEAARKQVSHIVGRDTKQLTKSEISRAAIESLAENSSDGVIAPLFWLALFGLPGIAVYKAINTADSMVGHLNERYCDFGWASAKTDDLVNWIPARLTAIFYAIAAEFTLSSGGRKSWQSAKDDAPSHVSPNAGWPEAAMAGALGFALGGPRNYGGKTLDLALMGNGRRELAGEDVFMAIKLYLAMLNIALLVSGFLALFQVVLQINQLPF